MPVEPGGGLVFNDGKTRGMTFYCDCDAAVPGRPVTVLNNPPYVTFNYHAVAGFTHADWVDAWNGLFTPHSTPPAHHTTAHHHAPCLYAAHHTHHTHTVTAGFPKTPGDGRVGAFTRYVGVPGRDLPTALVTFVLVDTI